MTAPVKQLTLVLEDPAPNAERDTSRPVYRGYWGSTCPDCKVRRGRKHAKGCSLADLDAIARGNAPESEGE